MKTFKAGLLATAAFALISTSSASAETLADALALAYQTNPNLQSQRAQLRALDESYVQARSGYRPSLSISAGSTYLNSRQFAGSTNIRNDVEDSSGSLGVSASQLLYDGGRTAANTSAVEADILSGRERLREVEGAILLDVVQTYAAVRRDQALLEIRRQTVDAYRAQADGVSARLRRGDVTRTDLGQVEAQLALAGATYSAAEAQLQFSRAGYATLVGQNPGQLEPEPTLVGLPAQLTEAFDAVERDNPAILQAILNERAANHRIAVAAASYGPTVGVRASLGYDGPLNPIVRDRYLRDVSGSVTISQPLYSGGFNTSTVRAARETASAQRSQIEVARRDAVQRASQAWNQMISSRTQQQLAEAGMRGAQTSVEGSRLEYAAGLRSTLELLIEQQRLRDIEALAVQARYNDYVGQAQLLFVMGRMDVDALTDGVPIYDPKVNFNRVRNKGFFVTDPLVEGLNKLATPTVYDVAEPAGPAVQAVMTPAAIAPAPNAALSIEVPTGPLSQSERADAIGDIIGGR